MVSNKLPPQPQDWFDENRERFGAQTIPLELKGKKCNHHFLQETGTRIGCKHCHNKWIEPKFKAIEGKIVPST